MTELSPTALMGAEAQPLSMTVNTHEDHWVVRIWWSESWGNPDTRMFLVYESTLSCVNVPLVTTHHTLWTAVALTVQDFAEGVGIDHNGE